MFSLIMLSIRVWDSQQNAFGAQKAMLAPLMPCTDAISYNLCFQLVFAKMIYFLLAEKETYMVPLKNVLTLCIVKNEAKVSPLIEKISYTS